MFIHVTVPVIVVTLIRVCHPCEVTLICGVVHRVTTGQL